MGGVDGVATGETVGIESVYQRWGEVELVVGVWKYIEYFVKMGKMDEL